MNLAFEAAKRAAGVRQMLAQLTPAEQRVLRLHAREEYAEPSDDDIEVDPDAKLSQSDTGWGVQAWVHVSDYDPLAAEEA